MTDDQVTPETKMSQISCMSKLMWFMEDIVYECTMTRLMND